MGFQAKIPVILGILALALLPNAAALDAAFKESLETFSSNMFQQLMLTNGQDNIIYSPFSVHTCLTMAQMGADGETAAEINNALGYRNQTSESIADNYYSLLARYEDSDTLHLANKLYVMKGYDLDENYNELLESKFFAGAELIDFRKKNRATRLINKWVEGETNHLIKNLVSPSMIESGTRLLLLSAIHFKGVWEHPFKLKLTKKGDFYTDETNSVQVDMMITKFRETSITYGRVPDFHFVRMPYKDSDLSMMVFVPFQRTGLASMLETLRNSTLADMTAIMYEKYVEISMPKFKVEFEIDLTEPLQKLGMSRLFENAALGKMFKNSENVSVSRVVHKACIEVTEKGTKASAATGLLGYNRILSYPVTADHPFYYAIVNTDNVILFQGTVVDF